MLEARFQIDGAALEAQLVAEPESFSVQSSPRAYPVRFCRGRFSGATPPQDLQGAPQVLLVYDWQVAARFPAIGVLTERYPGHAIAVCEENKQIDSVLAIADFLQQHKASRSSMVYVIGGGMVQDLGAFACYLYKRGVPWTFVPTTLLAQGDSCVGGKTAINHKHTKNLLGLFSAPRAVEIDTGFLAGLGEADWLSGLGEIFRLAVTGGETSLALFEELLPACLARQEAALEQAIACALRVKRAVVEHDEFELSARRSMNYGHSVGHMLEALTDFAVPHGIAVSFGMLVENELALEAGWLDQTACQRLFTSGKQLLPASALQAIAAAGSEQMLDLLTRDKKVENGSLKLAVPAGIGHIRFLDFPLDAPRAAQLAAAMQRVLAQLQAA